MKRTLRTSVGVALGLGAICGLAVGQINGQPNQGSSTPPPLATNWIGYVVFGVEETMDQIILKPGVFPKAEPRLQIGLRSDGIVVWRKTPAGQ